ncbi:ATP binding protein, putative isoform 1 [Hibiscus syriacus]|uniref:ATP binding protein, putative isoform 1 n=1 Tax=Hibiscus syriacus TaxID=106335 RepID=A0A6A2Y4J2_HIBSY|nr:ATP binding protein, putative isoform 1 [Hibiscus syriacus]
MTLVSAFFSDPDSSQLLAGAMASPGAKLPYNPMDGSFMEMGFENGGEKNPGFKQNRPLNLTVGNSPLFTVPPGLSPSGLLTSPGFFIKRRSKMMIPTSMDREFNPNLDHKSFRNIAPASIGTSYGSSCPSPISCEYTTRSPEYQTLSVTAPLEPSKPYPSINTEETSQQMPLSASDPQSSAVEYSEASQFNKKSQPSVAVDKPAKDGYNWRKYGQKHIKSCEVKNHEKPQPNKQPKGGGDGNTNSQDNLELGSLGVDGNSNNLSEIVPAHSIPGENHESTQAVELSGLSDGEEGCDEESREERDDFLNLLSLESFVRFDCRNAAGEVAVVMSHKTVMDSKIIVQTRSEVDLLNDDYRWLKYGQKVVKGNPHPSFFLLENHSIGNLELFNHLKINQILHISFTPGVDQVCPVIRFISLLELLQMHECWMQSSEARGKSFLRPLSCHNNIRGETQSRCPSGQKQQPQHGQQQFASTKTTRCGLQEAFIASRDGIRKKNVQVPAVLRLKEELVRV